MAQHGVGGEVELLAVSMTESWPRNWGSADVAEVVYNQAM